MGEKTRVIGVADDEETMIKRGRVLKLANDVLELTGVPGKVTPDDVVSFIK